MGISRRAFTLSAAALASASSAGPGFAKGYPDRPVKLVSPFAPGGGTDILGRVLAQKFSELLGENMIVENRAGAGGNTGALSVAKADPDGHTLLMAVNSYTINAHAFRSVPFDLLKDFAPVGMVATSPFMLAVHASVPAKSVKELIAYAREKRGQLNFGSAGLATAPHLACELFNLTNGLDMRHVPYQGSGPNMTGLLRGDVQMSAIALSSIEGHLASDQIRVLGVMSPQRMPRFPDIPAVAEAVPGFEVDLWYALLAPRGVPAPVIATLSDNLKKALESADMRDGLPPKGFLPAFSTPDALTATMERDLARWKDVTERIGLKL